MVFNDGGQACRLSCCSFRSAGGGCCFKSLCMLDLTLGFGRILSLGCAGVWNPSSSSASLSGCAWLICGGVWCVHGGFLCLVPNGISGLGVVGGRNGLSDGVLVDFERVYVV